MSDRSRSVKAVVQKVLPKGRHGPYAVAKAERIDGSITFSLEPAVWNEKDWPKTGEFVLLSKFRQKRAGWRAMAARFFGPSDKQRAKSKEHIMKRITAVIERWRSKFFPSETDKVWQDWVDFKGRELRDLRELIEDAEIGDEFKARALFLMLTPDLAWCPFYWTNRRSYVRGHSLKLDGLSPDLLAYVAELVTEFYQHLKDTKRAEDVSQELNTYNYYVLTLVALLPDEQAENIFSLFEINDRSGHYRPLGSLFARPKVDEKWKREADLRMRQVITNELAGETCPRAEHEEALWRYANLIQPPFTGDLPYSPSLFVEQIAFIISVAPQYKGGRHKGGRRLINSWQVAKIFKIIASERPEYLYDFSRFVMTSKDEDFWVYNQETLEAAELMLGAVSGDAELVQRLQDVFLSGQQRLVEEGRKHQEKARVEQSILERMRRPN